MTVAEYLRFEAAAEAKHEFCDGEVIERRGDADHALIGANVSTELHGALRGTPCRVYDSSLRSRIPHRACYRYPDVTVVCGACRFDPTDRWGHSLVNATLVVEVTNR